jgi:opacity protein-like surface antigen
VRKIAGVLLGVFFAAGMAQAQIPTSGNIFIGYSFSRAEPSPSVNLNGWEASLEGKFLPWVGIVGDFGATYGSTSFIFPCPPSIFSCGTFNGDVKRYTYLFGPRVSVPVGRFTPFAQFLIGAAHINSFGDTDNSFATAVGGGLDYRLIHGLAVRLQGDDIHTNFFGVGENHFRLSAGIDIRF